MIYGIGCDICEIERIRNTGERFLTRNFTEQENALFDKKKNSAESVTANFAAKEAFSKALGTGIRGFEMREIEVLRDEMGKPFINLYGNALRLCNEIGINKIFVSLSHSNGFAAAYVILEI